MRRLNSLLRTPVFFALSLAVYAIARWAASAGEVATRFPDSLGYEHLNFSGNIERFWVVPLMYSIVRTDSQRVILHIAIGVFAWGYLAWRIGSITRLRRVFITGVLVLGLTPQIIHFDLAILSESLGISFAVGALAATLHLSQSSSRLARLLWVVFLVLTSFTRPVNLVVVFACAGYSIVKYFLSRHHRHRASMIFLVSLSLWGAVQLRGNESASAVNFYTVLQRRICPNNDAYNWFIAHGLPEIAGLREVRGYGRSTQLENDVREIVHLPMQQMPPMTMIAGGVVLAQWVQDHGWTTYAKYIATHPSSAVRIIQAKAHKTLGPRDETFLPTRTRTIIPHQLFDPWWAWLMIALATLAISWLSRAKIRIVQAMTALGTVTTVVFAASILTSAVEYERHGATVAAMVRVLAIASLALALGREKAIEPSEDDDVLSR